MAKRVFAIAAHPDDIEFMMAGTMMLLKERSYELHYMTVANGSCGTAEHDRETIIQIRRQESINAAEFIGAVYHESLCDDIEIFYEKKLLTRLGSVIREVAPEILLVPSPVDYMEDHVNTSRLAGCHNIPCFTLWTQRSAKESYQSGNLCRYNRGNEEQRTDVGNAQKPEGVAG